MATPSITKVTQTYENESIECARLVFSEPGSYKFAQIVSAETDYIFQFVCKSESATTLTIQVGDTVKTQAITTDFARYVIPFPNTTNDNTSLYITFPAGTYYLFNLQLERATTASAWRPAPEDAEDYADEASRKAVEAQTQEEIFNKLTNNGETQGLYLLDGKVYINASYIQSGTLTGDFIRGGVISGTEINIGDGVFVVDENGEVTASNINIWGGSINIITDSDENDVIRLSYETTQGETTSTFMPNGLNAATTSSNGTRKFAAYYASSIELDHNGHVAYMISTGTGGPLMSMYNISSTGVQSQIVRLGSGGPTINPFLRLYRYNDDTSRFEADPTGITVYASGKVRVTLNANGLYFYNSSGTLTKSYLAT